MTSSRDKLPAVTWAGTFPEGRARARPPQNPPGIVFHEMDHHGEGGPPPGWLWAEKERLAANDSVVAVYVSCGGQGLHVLVAVTPTPTTKVQYRSAWTAALEKLELTEKAGPAVKNIDRQAVVSHDPDAYINLSAQYRWRGSRRLLGRKRPPVGRPGRAVPVTAP